MRFGFARMALRVGGACALGFAVLGNPVCLTNSTLLVTAGHRRRAAAMPADAWPDKHSTGGVSNIGLSTFLMTEQSLDDVLPTACKPATPLG